VGKAVALMQAVSVAGGGRPMPPKLSSGLELSGFRPFRRGGIVSSGFTLLLLSAMLSGCFGGEEEPAPGPSPFDFDEPVPATTWYHYTNATDARNTTHFLNGSTVLTDNNTPFLAAGTYYGIGMSTFEPTIGATSDGNLYMTSWGNGQAGSTAMVKCAGLNEMVLALEYSCEDVYNPPLLPVANSNDPYLYVDPWTDRLMKFDMHALLGMTVEWSDDEGASWSPPTPAGGWAVQDHQTIASSPYSASLHPTTWVYCINGGYPFPMCSASSDGGNSWGPELPGAPLDCNSGGLTAHLVGSENGNFYRGNPGCDGTGYSIFRSDDGGITWSEHPLPTAATGTAATWNAEEAAVAADDADNVHAMWMGLDNMPYYSYSRDAGASWSDVVMIAPPNGVNGTGFPAIAAGADGRVAFGYIGTKGDGVWHGYLTVMTDAFGVQPLMTTVQVNLDADPLDLSEGCGYERCGGFGDFIDLVVDSDGRVWFGLSHNPTDEGIFATMAQGPRMRGPLEPLPPLVLGGNGTLVNP